MGISRDFPNFLATPIISYLDLTGAFAGSIFKKLEGREGVVRDSPIFISHFFILYVTNCLIVYHGAPVLRVALGVVTIVRESRKSSRVPT